MNLFLKDPRTWYTIVGFLFGILVAGPLGNRLWDWPNVWPLTLLALIAATGVALWRRHVAEQVARREANTLAYRERERRLAELRAEFALCKPVARLQPRDFGYELLDPGEIADVQSRPFYSRYVPRRIVPLAAAESPSPENILTEAVLANHLAAGRDMVLLGQPTMGKSRALYEVVSQLPDWVIISPRKKGGVPLEEAFHEFVTERSVVLVLDDLNNFATGSAPDLGELREAIRRARPTTFAIAATCRDGSELSVVGNAVDSSLRRFYDDIALKVVLLPQSDEEKAAVAANAGKIDWDASTADLFPTPGSIVMQEALRYQRSRFGHELPGVERDTLRSLRLLTAGGVLPLTQSRIETVLTHVFGRQALHLGEVLDDLAAESFIRRPARQDPCVPELAYLGDAVVTYREGASPVLDFPGLQQALEAAGDDEGLALHGV